jgi:hypothetical protein
VRRARLRLQVRSSQDPARSPLAARQWAPAPRESGSGAGALLIREAGGLAGDDKYLESGHIAAANSKLFGAFLKLLNSKG